MKKKIGEYISDYEKEKNVKLAKEEFHWGREGETNYCFKLTELSQNDQESFISKIKSLSMHSKQINIMENSPCRRGK